jgi:hypothetical protein
MRSTDMATLEDADYGDVVIIIGKKVKPRTGEGTSNMQSIEMSNGKRWGLNKSTQVTQIFRSGITIEEASE